MMNQPHTIQYEAEVTHSISLFRNNVNDTSGNVDFLNNITGQLITKHLFCCRNCISLSNILSDIDLTLHLAINLNDNFDFIELGKLAIDYSDGIVQADKVVNEELLNYANGKNIPVLGYHEDFADEYEAFYDQIYPDEPEVEED